MVVFSIKDQLKFRTNELERVSSGPSKDRRRIIALIFPSFFLQDIFLNNEEKNNNI